MPPTPMLAERMGGERAKKELTLAARASPGRLSGSSRLREHAWEVPDRTGYPVVGAHRQD